MPDQNDQSIVTQWKGFDEGKRKSLLQRMTPDQKANLRRLLEGEQKPTATISASPPLMSIQGMKNAAVTARDKIINQLPTIGGTVGGIIGAGAGAESGPGAVLTGSAGAAAGGGLGETLRQGLTEHFHPEDKKMNPAEALTGIGKQAAGQGAAELVGGGIGAALKPTLTKTIQRLYFAGNLGPKEELEAVMPEIMAAEKAKPVTTIGDFKTTVGEIKNRIGTEVDTAIQPIAGTQTSGQPVSNQILNLIQNHPSNMQMNPKRIAAIRGRATQYASPKTFKWLNDRRIVLNDELNHFYALKTPAEKAQYLSTHPNFEIDKAEADAIRDVVYPEMDRAAGKPKGYFEGLQKKRGALKSIESQVDEHIQDLRTKTKRTKGAPLSSRPRLRVGETGKPGITTYLTSLLPAPDLEKRASKQTARAFGHTVPTRVGKALSSQTGKEVLALPLRELFNPSDEPEQ